MGRPLLFIALAGALALGGLLLPRSDAHAQSPAVQACIEENLVRYAEPGTSAEAQYVDIEAACNDAVDDNNGAEIEVSPGAPQGGGDNTASPSGAPGSSQGSTGGDAGPSTQGPTPTQPPNQPQQQEGESGGAQPSSPPEAASSLAAIAEPPTSASAPGPFAGAPAWVIGLIGAAAGFIVVATVLQIRRTRS